MKKIRAITLALSAAGLALAGCSSTGGLYGGTHGADYGADHADQLSTHVGEISPSLGEVYTTAIITNDRSTIGQLTITQMEHDVKAHIILNPGHISPGLHGMHFHAVGDCSDEKFLNTKSHINTQGKSHGLNHTDGPDNADLPNLVADASGYVSQTVNTPRLSFNGDNEAQPALFDADGSALVIHASEDDQITQPIGGAGARVACATVK